MAPCGNNTQFCQMLLWGRSGHDKGYEPREPKPRRSGGTAAAKGT
jgi:hypothetical protein